MTLAFLVGVAILFAAVLAWEAGPDDKQLLRPTGLLRWLTSGNWPAKVGAGLLLVGTGALLRYLMLNIDFPASVKLLAGVVFSATFGIAAGMLQANSKRRALYLAFGGAASGTAYLSAYSAYSFFQYLDQLQALGLLFVIACGATVFAMTTRALSIAVLAMVGAYIAPAFSLETPEPLSVYGYYVLTSFLTWVMVWQRGWRPLIHLSFLFTLAGALFFGWTREFYAPAFYPVMQPLLLALVAIHLAMPLFELKNTESTDMNGPWQRRFDLGYFLFLPLVALVLTLLVAPDDSRDGVAGLLALAFLWLVAAAVQHRRFKQGAPRYAGVAFILLLIAALISLGQVSFFLVGAVVACTMLSFGPKLGVPAQLNGLLTTVALAGAACYLLQALFIPVDGTPFFNLLFARHALLVAALAVAGVRMRERGLSLAPVFITLAGGWFVIASAREYVYLYSDDLPQSFYLLVLVATAVYSVALKWRAPRLSLTLLLGLLLFYTGVFSAKEFAIAAALPLMLAGQVVFSALAYMAGRHAEEGESVAGVARSMLPLLLLPWAAAFSHSVDVPQGQVVMTLLVSSALFASLQSQLILPHGRYWPNTLSPIAFVIFGAWLFYQSLFHIQRETWAVAYELIALAYLVLTVRFLLVAKNRDARLFSIAALLAIVSVCVAMLLRFVGPPGPLTILALSSILLPATVSLLWAVIGAAITWWATREQSRRLWSAGALLLVAAAIKLVLFDFGSLGQLGNIFAMMAAGGVFLLVAWLAPFPPKAEKKPGDDASLASRSAPEGETRQPRMIQEKPIAAVAVASRRSIRVESTDNKESGGRGWLWAAVGVAAVGLVLYGTEQRAVHRARAHSDLQEKAKYEKVAATALPEAQPTTVSEAATASPVAPPGASQVLSTEETATSVTELRNRSSIGQAAPTAIPAERPAGDVQKLQSFEFDRNDSKSANPSLCGFLNLVLPQEFTVVAAGGYAGRLTDFQIDQSGHQATQIDVAVHHPDKPVVLMLGAYEPNIWNIGWSPQTRIVAIVVSGYHRQAVAGLDKSVPVLNSSHDNKGACGYFYISSERNEKLNPLSQRLFGRTVDMVYPAANGKVLIGNSLPEDVRLITSSHTPAQSYYDKTAPLAGQAGLDDAVSRGVLRPATAADARRWAEAVARKNGTSLPPVAGARDSLADASHLFRTYVIAKPFVFPSGLYGAHSATFFVLEGVPPPRGNPGHSSVSDFNAVFSNR